MPTIPTYQPKNINLPRGGGIQPGGSNIGAGVRAIGQSITNVGLDMAQKNKELRQTQQVIENTSQFSMEIVQKENEILSSPEWNNHPEDQVKAFETYIQERQQAYLENIEDQEVEQVFLKNANQFTLNKTENLFSEARKKRIDIAQGKLIDSVQTYQDIAVQAQDRATFNHAYAQVQSAFSGAADSGAIDQVDAVEMFEEWKQNVERETMLRAIRTDPEKAIDALKNQEFNFIEETERASMLKEAEAQLSEKQQNAAYDQAVELGDRLDAIDYIEDDSGLKGEDRLAAISKINTYYNQIEKANEEDRGEWIKSNDLDVTMRVMNQEIGEAELDALAENRGISRSVYKWAKDTVQEQTGAAFAEDDDPFFRADLEEDITYNRFEDAEEKLDQGLRSGRITASTYTTLKSNMYDRKYKQAFDYVRQATSVSQLQFAEGVRIRSAESRKRFYDLVGQGENPMDAGLEVVQEYGHALNRDLETMAKPRFYTGPTRFTVDNFPRVFDQLEAAKQQTIQQRDDLGIEEYTYQIELIEEWKSQVEEMQKVWSNEDVMKRVMENLK